MPKTGILVDPNKEYTILVPPLAKGGSTLKLTIPGVKDKVTITLPEDAQPGASISFQLPKTPAARKGSKVGRGSMTQSSPEAIAAQQEVERKEAAAAEEAAAEEAAVLENLRREREAAAEAAQAKAAAEAATAKVKADAEASAAAEVKAKEAMAAARARAKAAAEKAAARKAAEALAAETELGAAKVKADAEAAAKKAAEARAAEKAAEAARATKAAEEATAAKRAGRLSAEDVVRRGSVKARLSAFETPSTERAMMESPALGLSDSDEDKSPVRAKPLQFKQMQPAAGTAMQKSASGPTLSPIRLLLCLAVVLVGYGMMPRAVPVVEPPKRFGNGFRKATLA